MLYVLILEITFIDPYSEDQGNELHLSGFTLKPEGRYKLQLHLQ